jgi:opine dehydrogenase
MFTRKSSVAVLGAGHGGLALAGYLGQRGHRVALWNRSLERVAPVRALGGIRLTMPGKAPIIAPIAKASCSMASVLADAAVVLVAVPASGHAEVARNCAHHLRNGQTVLLLPGRTGGSLEFRRVLQETGCRAEILLGETNTFPFASRCVGRASAQIFGSKAEVLAAALPATRTADLLAECRPFLPMLAAAESVLQTGLGNLGAILHPAITLLNADRIERGDTFDFYADGVTPQVADTLAAADEERLRIADEYRVPACSLQEWIGEAYGHHASTIRGAVGGNPAYVGIKAPNTLDHRYLLEDVPTGLIPLIEFGEAAGLAVPTLKNLVDTCRITLGGEPWQTQRTLDVLGLDGLSTTDIRTVVEGEEVPAVRRSLLPRRSLSGIWGGMGQVAFVP